MNPAKPERKYLLSPKMEKVLDVLRRSVFQRPGFRLVGGTALSEYYLGHRVSDDFDVFVKDANQTVDAADMLSAVAAAQGMRIDKDYTQRGAARLYLDNIKVEIVGDETLEDAEVMRADDGVSLADMPAIAGMKWRTIASRGEVKDLYDLWRLDDHVDMDAAVIVSERKDSNANNCTRAFGLEEARKRLPVKAPPWHIAPEKWDRERQELELFVRRWMKKFIGREFYTL